MGADFFEGSRSMSGDLEDFEFAFIFRTNDPKLRQDLEHIVPPDDISASDNFVGGTEIAIFLKYGRDVLKAIMGVLSQRKSAVTGLKLVVNKAEFRLEASSAEEAEKILNSPGFRDALKSTQKSR